MRTRHLALALAAAATTMLLAACDDVKPAPTTTTAAPMTVAPTSAVPQTLEGTLPAGDEAACVDYRALFESVFARGGQVQELTPAQAAAVAPRVMAIRAKANGADLRTSLGMLHDALRSRAGGSDNTAELYGMAAGVAGQCGVQ